MDKAKLAKSQSSNSTIRSKETVGNKSRSNAEFKMIPVKKRGVYVEKQEIDLQPRLKAPPRSKPGTKKFLASVLTILSKSTTGTQCPPDTRDDPTELQKPHRKYTKQSSKNPKSATPRIESKSDILKISEQNTTASKKAKKPKYRSRILNGDLNKDVKDPTEKVLVVKSKKEIIQTPSNNSKSTRDNVSNQSIKWADFLPKLIDSETGGVKANAQKNQHQIDERVAKCIEEGNELNMQRQMLEPTTLVSAPEKDEKLYNIFVNLLETVYDEKPDEDVASSVKTGKSSKFHFEMDDKVAEKLYKPLDKQEHIENASNYFRQHHSKKSNDNDRNKQQLAEYYFNSRPLAMKWSEAKIRPPKIMRTVKKKKPVSPVYPKEPPSTKTQSEIMQERRTYYKRTKKKDLLNVLKQQLWIDERAFEEPDNFYQSLRVMAESKRRQQKSIHFDVPPKKDDEYDPVCRFKRRKVITPSKKVPASKLKEHSDHSRRSPSPPPPKKHPEVEPIRCMPESEANSDDSAHTLEVYGFDYDMKKRFVPERSDYSDTDTANEGVTRINNWNRGFRTITQLWNQ